MAVITSQVYVDETVGTVLCQTNPKRRSLYIKNTHNNKVYIGPPGVVSGDGFHVDADETIVFSNHTSSDCAAKNEFHAIMDSAQSGIICVMEITD
jgi:hypothetical protein